MNSSKITLAAQRTERTMLYRRPIIYPMSYEGAYSKAQQRQNRANNKISQAQARRNAYTHLLCEIGGLWLKNFPACKGIDPYDKARLTGVARAMAILASDPQFTRLWLKITAEMKVGQQEKSPTGPD